MDRCLACIFAVLRLGSGIKKIKNAQTRRRAGMLLGVDVLAEGGEGEGGVAHFADKSMEEVCADGDNRGLDGIRSVKKRGSLGRHDGG